MLLIYPIVGVFVFLLYVKAKRYKVDIEDWEFYSLSNLITGAIIWPLLLFIALDCYVHKAKLIEKTLNFFNKPII